MEWLAPGVTDIAQLQLLGQILAPGSASLTLRQALYRPGLDWNALIAMAAAHDVLPPMIWCLRNKAMLPPVPRGLDAAKREAFLTTRLDETYRGHAARQEDLRAQVKDILAALHRAGVPALLLKGARYLLAPETSWGAARPMRDIDLLIHPEHQTVALNTLQDLQYIPDDATGLQSHHLPELRKAGRHGVVELHTEALSAAANAILPTALFWQAAIPAPECDGLILPPAYQALHAMAHHQISDDGYKQRNPALKGLWEFAQLTHAMSDVERCDLSDATKAADMIASWREQARILFGMDISIPAVISPRAKAQAQACFTELMHHQTRRRARFLWRQFQRGFSGEVLGQRYGVQPKQVGLRLRLRHLRFLLRRYRGHLRERLLG